MYASEGFFEYNWLTIFIFYDIMRSGAIILRWRLLSQIYEGGFLSETPSARGGGVMVLTYEQLMLFCMFVLALLSFLNDIYKNNDKKR